MKAKIVCLLCVFLIQGFPLFGQTNLTIHGYLNQAFAFTNKHPKIRESATSAGYFQ